eukprot:1004762-Amphidinium_carterae.1
MPRILTHASAKCLPLRVLPVAFFGKGHKLAFAHRWLADQKPCHPCCQSTYDTCWKCQAITQGDLSETSVDMDECETLPPALSFQARCFCHITVSDYLRLSVTFFARNKPHRPPRQLQQQFSSTYRLTADKLIGTSQFLSFPGFAFVACVEGVGDKTSFHAFSCESHVTCVVLSCL